jgi:hypothetical protein
MTRSSRFNLSTVIRAASNQTASLKANGTDHEAECQDAVKDENRHFAATAADINLIRTRSIQKEFRLKLMPAATHKAPESRS